MAENNAFQTLKKDLKEKRPGNLYVFHGEEGFLLRYYFQQLKKLLIDDVTESFNFHFFNNETFSLQAFTDSVENFPMMAEHTMVWVDDVDLFRLPEGERTHIANVLSDVPEFCCVVFTYSSVAWKPGKEDKNLLAAIKDNGQIVEFQKQEQRDLIPWIGRHFAAEKKQISTELCAYLIDITDGTMTSLSGEIKKICAYSGADVIKKTDIDAVTEPVLDAVIYQMTDGMGRGEYAVALEKLRVLLKMQEEPVVILGALGSHIRRLSAARVLMDNGKGVGELMNLYGMKEYPAKKAIDAARRFSPGFYAKATECILETDRGMKTSLDAPHVLLELLILRLAQEARNG